MENYCRLPRL